MEDHYNSHLASSYESAFFYSEDEYMKFLCERTRDKLGISSSMENKEEHRTQRRLVDIGGGTGNFTEMLVKDDSGLDAVIVDPFLSPSDDDNEDSKIRFVKASAEEFQLSNDSKASDDLALPWWRTNYNLVLLKEVVHHLPLSDRVEIFRGLRHGLVDDKKQPASSSLEDDLSSLLIITRPSHNIDYPLWPAALKVWAKNQPSVESLETDLRLVGYQNVRHIIEVYEFETELSRWLCMIGQRFWSTFSEFSDLELEDACEQIAKGVEVDEGGRIKFEDRLVFITACK